MDVRPGGRVLQGPPFSGRVVEIPAEGIPFDVGEIEGRLPDLASDVPEVVASESLFGARVPKPELGSELPFVLAKGMVNVKIVGFFKMSGLVPAFPTLYVNKAAMEAVTKLSPDFRPLPNLLLVVTKAGADPADLGLVIDEVPEADACQLYTVDAVASRFRSDTVSHLVSQLPMSLTLDARRRRPPSPRRDGAHGSSWMAFGTGLRSGMPPGFPLDGERGRGVAVRHPPRMADAGFLCRSRGCRRHLRRNRPRPARHARQAA